jgi:polyphosphate kinase
MDQPSTALTDQCQALDMGGGAIKDQPGRFINRELSWLEFNRRVHEEAMNPAHPLLERLRFLSISASNLDEFYMVRVAGLKGQVASHVRGVNPDCLSPAQQLRAIAAKVSELAADQHRCLEILLEEMRKEGLHLVSPDDLSGEDRSWLATMFRQNIFPILSPIAVDPAHPFPFIPNLGFGLVLELKGNEFVENLVALVILPAQLDRFIRLPGKSIRFIALEKVVLMFLDLLFPSFILLSSGTFRVIRDSEMEIDEEAEDLVRTFESALKRRRRGSVVRLTVDDEISENLLYFIQAQLDVSKHDVFSFKGMIGLSDIAELVIDDRPELLFPPIVPGFRSGSGITTVTAWRPFRPRTSSSITPTRASMWWSSSSARPVRTSTWWPSARPCTGPVKILPSFRHWWRPPKPAKASPPWWS